MSDYLTTAWGRAASLIAATSLWWLAAGALTGAGHPTMLLLAGLALIPVVAVQVGRYGPARWPLIWMSVCSTVLAVEGWLLSAHPDFGASVFLVVPATAAFVAALKCLPPVCVMSPELRSWMTPSEIEEVTAAYRERTGQQSAKGPVRPLGLHR